ncbi:MAG: iron-containing alcohol dehydrogenase [Acidimicrobiia bacterium]|nr:iron-containing alcohol dehydrogenase [Acidimicrobiia bacterium]
MLNDAKGFVTEYGRGLLGPLSTEFDSFGVVTQPEPWAEVGPQVEGEPTWVVMADDLSPDHLNTLVDGLEEVSAVIGIGGGTAMDTAKWLHWRRQTPLYQLPSLPSVNACFTRMTALRDQGGVRYEGDAVPEKVLVDYDLFAAAPAELVRGGIGDVLSCHTARFDWELAVASGHDPGWDEEAAAMSLVYLEELADLAPQLASAADIGIRRLMECHRDIGWRCHDLGHARFEEGSEHFFAYSFEAITGRTIMHGELVALGVQVMSTLQGNNPEVARSIIEASGMRHRLDDLGVTWDEVERSLKVLPEFVEEQGLWFSVANGMVIGAGELEAVRQALDW